MTHSVRVSFVIALIAGLLLPFATYAVGLDADMQCIPAKPSPCGCGREMIGSPPHCTYTGNKYLCPCKDTTSGFTTSGICQLTQKCEAKGTSGPNGFGLDQVQKILGDLMSKLMQGKQGGGSPPPGGAPPAGAGGPGCTLTSTNDQSLAQSNPQCYYYVTPTSSFLGSTDSGVGSSNVSDSLLNSLGGTTSDISNTDTNTNANVSSVIQNATQASVSDTASSTSGNSSRPIISVTQSSNLPAANLTPGLSGNIQMLSNGGTILANNVDTGKNSTVAGFFGTDSFNGQPQGVVGGLCQSRPWASFFLSYVIPSTFFDSLCVLKGYTVGTPAPAQTPTVTVVQSGPKTITPTPTVPAGPVVAPKVDIWASPASVALGSRTSVFWTSQGVTNCTETSPDGNFSQSTLSGGASTAPITGATVFTISCLAPDGSHVTDNVTVNLAI